MKKGTAIYLLQHEQEVKKAISNLAIFTVKGTKRKPLVAEYVDVTTGEIIDAETAYKMGVRAIRPDAMKQRLMKLDSLRREPREFANFLLKFRDDRCKFLVPMVSIVSWYSKLTGMETRNIRRYFPCLIKAQILDSDLMLNEDFMINNPNAGKAAAKGDLFRAYNVFDLMMVKKNSPLK